MTRIIELLTAMRFKWKWRLFALIVIFGYSGTFLAFMSLSLTEKTAPSPCDVSAAARTVHPQPPNMPAAAPSYNHSTAAPVLSRLRSKLGAVDEWQDVKDEQLYLYSAYYDGRRDGVVVVAVVQTGRASMSSKCALWYVDRPGSPDVNKAVISIVPDPHGVQYPYVAATVRCALLTEKAPPDFVSVHIQASPSEQWEIGNTNNILPVTNNWDREQVRRFTVCISPLHDQVSNNQMVEFIEVHRIFHAQHFVVYNATNSTVLHPYLAYYKDQGLVTVKSWRLPSPLTTKVHYFAQLAAINDCLYSNMHLSKYVVPLDLDEVIVPMKEKNWSKLLESKQIKRELNVTGCYSVQCVFLKAEFPSSGAYATNHLVQSYGLQTLLKTHMERKVYRHRDRSKLFLVPERVSQAGVHFVHKFVNKSFHAMNVPYSQAMLFHYKDWDVPQLPSGLEQNRMHEFAGDITRGVSLVHQRVAGEL